MSKVEEALVDGTNKKAFQNRVLETRDPKQLTLITEVWLKKYPEKADIAAPFYDKRADRTLSNTFLNQVKNTGYIHTPLFIADVPEIGEVVVAGRQRLKAALALGLTEVPVIMHDPTTDLSIELEITENEARQESTVLERGHTYKKAIQKGVSVARVAALAGLSQPHVFNTILVSEMPRFVHDMIEKGELSQTAAIQLKSFGKPAPKMAGVSKVYDDEAQKAMKESLTNMSAEAKLAGGKGGKITVRQARQSSPKGVDEMHPKNWDALIEDSNVPDDYKLLIQVFRGRLSWKQAKSQAPENLDWLTKKDPAPKPKKEKAPKKPKAKVDVPDTSQAPEDFDPDTLFQG